MSPETPHSWSCKCPLCGGPVPGRIIMLHAPFDCPRCGRALQLHRLHEIAVRALAFLFGFFLASTVSSHAFWTFLLAVVLSPFLVAPVWRASASIKSPVLSPAWSELTKLKLDANRPILTIWRQSAGTVRLPPTGLLPWFTKRTPILRAPRIAPKFRSPGLPFSESIL